MTESVPTQAGRPNPVRRREADLERLVETTWDVVIVGGGIVGAGALLDATTRGLKVALIEQDDIASGTSSRSSRLIHGGLRYLEQLQLGLVREALAERSRLLRNAPHLVSLEPLLFPIHGIPFLSKAFYDAGLTLYDILGARRDGGWHRRLSVKETLAIAPALRRPGLHGGLLYHDGMEDDARLTLAVVRTALAADEQSLAVTRVQATGVRTDPASGRLHALRARDLASGAEIEVPTRGVVDATGAWAADPDHAFSGSSSRILPSRGAHLVVPRERIPGTAGLTLRVPGKVVFLVPWPDHWLIGTTDAAYEGRSARPSADGWEIDELMRTVNETLDVDLRRSDVVGTYAGLRPLIAPTGGSTVKASREHRITVEKNGIVRAVGGKYTTYRVMAADLIDAVARELGATARSVTRDVPLLAGRDEELAALIAERPELGEPLAGGGGRLRAEVVHACTHEGALHLEDVLERRTRLALTAPDRALAAAAPAAALMASALGRDEEWARREAEAWRTRVAAARAGEAERDDASALAAYREVLAAREGATA
jgi:glycerol-3-phosphate dehydrogenase